MMKLYDYELSGDCCKVRLLLHILRVPYQRIELDVYPGEEHHNTWFLAINPSGQLPVLDNGGIIMTEVESILISLASQYDPTGNWYPRRLANTVIQVNRWLRFGENLSATAGAARLHDTMFIAQDIDKCRSEANSLFRALDEHLWFAEQQGQRWLCAYSHPTVADLGCFPHVILSEEGGISRSPYPAIRRWTDRVMGIAGFKAMAGVPT